MIWIIQEKITLNAMNVDDQLMTLVNRKSRKCFIFKIKTWFTLDSRMYPVLGVGWDDTLWIADCGQRDNCLCVFKFWIYGSTIKYS